MRNVGTEGVVVLRFCAWDVDVDGTSEAVLERHEYGRLAARESVGKVERLD